MELEEKVSDDSGRDDILLRLQLVGTPFCLQYRIVGVVAARALAQSQVLGPGRIERGEGRRVIFAAIASSCYLLRTLRWTECSIRAKGRFAVFGFLTFWTVSASFKLNLSLAQLRSDRQVLYHRQECGQCQPPGHCPAQEANQTRNGFHSMPWPKHTYLLSW